jgi:uncharacterized protein YyaL (SSP411 family)
MNLLRLYTLTTDEEYRIRAEMTLRTFSNLLQESPTRRSQMLGALDFLLDRPKEILIVTPSSRNQAEPFLRELRQVYLPNRVLVVASADEAMELVGRIPWLEKKRPIDGKTTAYVCEARVCDLPTNDTELFAKQLRKKPAPYPGEGTIGSAPQLKE